jgi:hypothetical protein
MIILLEKAHIWYEIINNRIKKRYNGKIIIIVSRNIDSLTALRILVGLFKSDVIPYEIIPVQNYDEVDKEIINCQKMEDEIKGFVFINCIGEIDLTKYWFCQEKKIIALITDTKRPIHHQNIRDKTNIVIIDDGMNNIEYCPTEKEMEIVRQRVIDINENEEKNKNEKNDGGEEEKNGEDEKKDEIEENGEEGENIYKIGDNKNNEEKDKSEKQEDDNDDENYEEEEGEENEKKGGKNKKKIIKKRNEINDEEFNELKNESNISNKEIDPLDEIADEVSVRGEKKSLNDENEELEEKENDEQENKLNEKIKEIQEINTKVNE